MEGPPAPKTPYRDGKALVDIIPPDRRREKMLALVGASMVTGVALWVLAGWAVEAFRSPSPAPLIVDQVPGYVAGRLPRSTLHGPRGGTVAMPPAERSIVHVWLQGCSDCMPAFEAMAQIYSEGSLSVGAPIVNVAYGEADETWAGRYGVATNLVFDPGGASVVKPLGIGTFTTLVVDPDGTVLLRDRPDRPGYVARVRAALDSGKTRPPPAPLPAQPELDAQAVQRVISSHQAGLKRTCWDHADRHGDPATVNVTLTLTVSTDGRVANTTSIADNPFVARCIETQAHGWVFPRPKNETTVNIPFTFVRE